MIASPLSNNHDNGGRLMSVPVTGVASGRIAIVAVSDRQVDVAPPPADVVNQVRNHASCLMMAILALAFFCRPATAQPSADVQGVWRVHGAAGKCLDVGGYPLGHSSPVILYDCNGTAAQEITAVPSRIEPGGYYSYELRAHGRCLGVGPLDIDTANAPQFAESGSLSTAYVAGMPIVLAPCDGSIRQRFGMSPPGPIVPMADFRFRIGARDGNSANRTPLVLDSANSPATDAETWSFIQHDTTSYDWTPPIATAGAFAFRGLSDKCIDVGGAPHPQHAPAFLFDCNGTIAQLFNLRPIDDDSGDYNISAFGGCLDISGALPRAGSSIELNTCSGADSQRFAFDNFDRQYIYAAGTPELVIGVRGAGTTNRTPLELTRRAAVDSQNWRPIAGAQPQVGAKAPAIRFYKQLIHDHRDGHDTTYYLPAVAVSTDPTLSTALELLWKPLGPNTYSSHQVFGGSPISYSNVPELAPRGVYLVKARATLSNGLFSESPAMIVDGRPLERPSLSVENVQPTEATVVWRSVGTPQASGFEVTLTGPHGSVTEQVAPQPGTGLSNLSYRRTVTDLQPNTRYHVQITVHRDLWGDTDTQGDVMTLPQSVDNGPYTTSITMSLQLNNVDGYLAYAGRFGPISDTGAVISNVNFPTQFAPVFLVKPGHSTSECGNPNAVVRVYGDMTADQKIAVWGTASLSIAGLQTLNFVGCIATPEVVPGWLPVNITWHRP
jgi:hypothetical protein